MYNLLLLILQFSLKAVVEAEISKRKVDTKTAG